MMDYVEIDDWGSDFIGLLVSLEIINYYSDGSNKKKNGRVVGYIYYNTELTDLDVEKFWGRSLSDEIEYEICKAKTANPVCDDLQINLIRWSVANNWEKYKECPYSRIVIKNGADLETITITERLLLTVIEINKN